MKKNILHTAIDLLSRREHAIVEINQKLIKRGYEQQEIESIIEQLIADDYLNEQRYADSVFRRRIAKGYGWLFIQNELSLKGISDSLINTLLDIYQIDWYVQAEIAYNKRYSDIKVKDNKDKLKRIRFMQQRGFSIEDIMTLINNPN